MLRRGSSSKLEQAIRRGFGQDAPKAAALDHRLRRAAIMIEIGEADAVDAGRQAADPAAPDQARDIQQIRPLVRHRAALLRADGGGDRKGGLPRSAPKC